MKQTRVLNTSPCVCCCRVASSLTTHVLCCSFACKLWGGGLASIGAAMALASKIDVEAKDRGLSSCFQAANVQDDWAAAFMRTHRPTSLEDFVYLVNSEKWESSWEGLLTAVPELKDSRLVLARFKSAYKAGLEAGSA